MLEKFSTEKKIFPKEENYELTIAFRSLTEIMKYYTNPINLFIDCK